MKSKINRCRALRRLDSLLRDKSNLDKYPGLRVSLKQREQYYTSKGQAVPDFPNPLETRRCIYGMLDLQKGIVRVGGAGQVTKLVNPGRPLYERVGEHVYAGKVLQDYWLSKRAAIPWEIKEPHQNHRYPLATFVAYHGAERYAVLPLCYVQ
jgi:hypothetical protein